MTTGFVDVLRDRARAVSAALEDVRRREETVRSEYAEKLREISEETTRLDAELRHLSALLALQGGSHKESGTEGAVALERLGMPADLRQEAYKLLAEQREPLHYTQMMEQLVLRGVHIPGKEPAKNLVAHIHNDPRFKRPRRGFYGLAEWYPKGAPSVGARRRTTKGRRQQPTRQPKAR
jgi:hypothetical protein